jgi:hypothetical protein
MVCEGVVCEGSPWLTGFFASVPQRSHVKYLNHRKNSWEPTICLQSVSGHGAIFQLKSKPGAHTLLSMIGDFLSAGILLRLAPDQHHKFKKIILITLVQLLYRNSNPEGKYPVSKIYIIKCVSGKLRAIGAPLSFSVNVVGSIGAGDFKRKSTETKAVTFYSETTPYGAFKN